MQQYTAVRRQSFKYRCIQLQLSLSMHSLPIPQYIFWVGMSFAFGGLWLFSWLVWLLGGGFFVCICGGTAVLSCFVFF